MKIINVWSLHFKDFIIEIEATDKELKEFEEKLKEKFDDKKFLINRI